MKPLAALRRSWWKRGHARFYSGRAKSGGKYAMNAGSGEAFSALVHELTELLTPAASSIVVDLGGGDGMLAAEVFRDCRMLVVMDMCRPPKWSGSHFVIGDINHPPFKNGTFSVLFSYSTFPHLGSDTNAPDVLRRWNVLLQERGTLFIGDIPERRKLLAAISRGVGKRSPILILKYYFAISMLTYFSREKLKRWVAAMGYQVRVVDQSLQRRFHRERFDLIATKRASDA